MLSLTVNAFEFNQQIIIIIVHVSQSVLLHVINISCSNLASFNIHVHLSGVKTFPDTLKLTAFTMYALYVYPTAF